MRRDRPLTSWRRAATIAAVFAAEGARWRRPLPERMRRACERLGPTFVKATQVLASTYGVVPERYVREFRRCLDAVAPLPASTCRAAVEAAFGRSIAELFAEFDDAPLASASIAQVHRARLRDGRAVVVKVRRPGLVAAVERDIALLRAATRGLTRFSRWARTVNVAGVVDEFERTVRTEMDFRREAAFQRRYAELVREVDPAHVFVPAVVDELVREEVVVQELVEGVPIVRADEVRAGGFDSFDLLARVVRVWLEVMIHHGLYHGDLHGGNVLFVQPGRAALIDFGVHGELMPTRRKALLDFLVFALLRDERLLARYFVRMGFVPASVQERALQTALSRVFAAHYTGKATAEQRFEELLPALVEVALGFGGTVPSDVMLVSRQQIYFAAHGRLLAPGRNLMDHAAMSELIFPKPKRQYLATPERGRRYRLPMDGDLASARQLACPICKIVVESDDDLAAGADVFCYGCHSELLVRSDGERLEMVAT